MKSKTVTRGIDHIGITVPNVDEAAKFLEDAFSAKALYDVVTQKEKPMKGAATEKQLGIPAGQKLCT